MIETATKTSSLPEVGLTVSYNAIAAKEQLENSVSEAVIITDAHFKVRGINEIAASFCGFIPSEVVGLPLFYLIKFEMIGTIINDAVNVLTKQGYWKGDVVCYHRNQKKVFSVRCSFIKASAGLDDFIVICAAPVIGSMDKAERKKLSDSLLHEQVQRQKLINQATIKAQEKERNRISGELHDNVNQLLMSAKLHICVAKNKAERDTKLLEKANEYILMAVTEIREMARGLTSAVITNAGLQKSIADIAATMLLLKNIQLYTDISDDLVKKLSIEKQLMVYRIIQEQSNNILKYAETKDAIISLKEVNKQVELIISDNGQGFNKSVQKPTGIGFINIFNRVDAYNGEIEIITSPGNGCSLVISFPIN